MIRRLVQDDVLALVSLTNLFSLVFEEHGPSVASETQLLNLLKSESFIALAAFSENTIVGGLTAYVLPVIYSDHPEAILYDLAVKPEFQRMGIGKRLINELKDYCVKNGIKIFFVMAEEQDEGAIEFYRATGGREQRVVNFLYELD